MDDAHLTGNLADTSVPEVLFKISSRNQNGTLRFQWGKWLKELIFQDGKVIFARSNDPDEQLGPHLIRQGKVSYRHILESGPKVGPNKRLGTVLVLEGYLRPNDLYVCVVDQVKEIIFHLFEWSEGTYEFIPGDSPTQEIITLTSSIDDLILSGVAKIWRWSMVRTGVIGMDAVFRKKEGWSSILKKVTLTREMEMLIDLLDQPRTLEELLQLSPFTNFETCRLIWAFSIIGIVEEILVAPAWEASEPEGDSTASLAAASMEPLEPVHQRTAEMASPTIKLQIPLELEMKPPEEPAPVTSAESLNTQDPYITNPGMELSFSDLQDLTDARPDTQPVPVVEDTFQWEKNILQHLKEFNECHRYLYEMARLELGAGATNFILRVLRRVCSRHPLVLDGVMMDEFGELEEPVLHSNIEANLVEDYQDALDELLKEERIAVRMFLDRKRVEVIESGLERMLRERKVSP